jgi:hypothetical protein
MGDVDLVVGEVGLVDLAVDSVNLVGEVGLDGVV